MNVKPNPSFLVVSTPVLDSPSWVAKTLAERANARELAEWVAAGAPTVAERLLALCPVTLMDAACELDVPYKSIRGHALGLMRQGLARMLRGKLVRRTVVE